MHKDTNKIIERNKFQYLNFLTFKKRKIYSKQLLYVNELAYFECDKKQLIINVEDVKIAPAICFKYQILI